jgi:hypothetical protein
VQFTPEIEALLDAAAERGAQKAMQSLGLHDDNAPKDVAELRSLLDSWRDVRKTVVKTVTQAITVFILGALALGAATKVFKSGAGD